MIAAAPGFTVIYQPLDPCLKSGANISVLSCTVERPTRRSFVTPPAKTELSGCLGRWVGRVDTTVWYRTNETAARGTTRLPFVDHTFKAFDRSL